MRLDILSCGVSPTVKKAILSGLEIASLFSCEYPAPACNSNPKSLVHCSKLSMRAKLATPCKLTFQMLDSKAGLSSSFLNTS